MMNRVLCVRAKSQRTPPVFTGNSVCFRTPGGGGRGVNVVRRTGRVFAFRARAILFDVINHTRTGPEGGKQRVFRETAREISPDCITTITCAHYTRVLTRNTPETYKRMFYFSCTYPWRVRQKGSKPSTAVVFTG